MRLGFTALRGSNPRSSAVTRHFAGYGGGWDTPGDALRNPGARTAVTARLAVVRHRLLGNAELVCAELGFSSGVIVAVKRRS